MNSETERGEVIYGKSEPKWSILDSRLPHRADESDRLLVLPDDFFRLKKILGNLLAVSAAMIVLLLISLWCYFSMMSELKQMRQRIELLEKRP